MGFSNYKMKPPATSGYWEVKFLDDSLPNTVETENGKFISATSVTFDVGSINYDVVEIFSDKIFYIKNIDNLNKIEINYIEDESFSFTRFLHKWIYPGGNLFRFNTPDVKKDFAKAISIKKFSSAYSGKPLIELEALVIPDDGIAFSFDWDDNILEKSITLQIVELKKLEVNNSPNKNISPMGI